VTRIQYVEITHVDVGGASMDDPPAIRAPIEAIMYAGQYCSSSSIGLIRFDGLVGVLIMP